MSIVYSKQTQNYKFVDLLFAFFALTLVLFILVPSNGNTYNSIRTAPGTLDDTRIHISGSASFSADQSYWNANCNHGWSSDAGCDTIIARTQSCSISVASAYCSQYKNHLQQHPNQ